MIEAKSDSITIHENADEKLVGKTSTIVIAPGQESSVEIKEDAKGQPRVTVKVYHADADEALATAMRLYKKAVSMGVEDE